MVRLPWSVILGDRRSVLSLVINPSMDSGTVERLFKIFYSHAAKIQLDLATETMVPTDQRSEAHEAVLAVLRIG